MDVLHQAYMGSGWELSFPCGLKYSHQIRLHKSLGCLISISILNLHHVSWTCWSVLVDFCIIFSSFRYSVILNLIPVPFLKYDALHYRSLQTHISFFFIPSTFPIMWSILWSWQLLDLDRQQNASGCGSSSDSGIFPVEEEIGICHLGSLRSPLRLGGGAPKQTPE